MATFANVSQLSAAPEGCLLLRVTGTVQGVGFRPFVYRLALEHGVRGWVRNDAEGVLIEASGAWEGLARFKEAVAAEAPPAARVEAVVELSRGVDEPGDAAKGFVIVESEDGGAVSTLISPDLPVCADCLRELFDPADPRYRYPFINCTNCGPRYSIIHALPYDRPLTTMKAFELCQRCSAEYHDPLHRRFHAQPTACPACGPKLHYLNAAGGTLAKEEAAVRAAAAALRRGEVLAVKGLGGYHLACDARNPETVQALRERKFRKEKPFALMARDLEALAGYVALSPAARALLESPARPIVLLPKGPLPLPGGLAPENAYLGVMLPYTPLHYLLFDDGAPELLVMTSANRSSEPIVYRDEEALERLRCLADAFLVGERAIARRVDDSVTQLVADTPVMVRRARGYAPTPVVASPRFKGPILALGAELKNSVTLAAHGYAFVSQHLGDLGNLDTFEAFTETIRDLCHMYRVIEGECLVVRDLHPAYPSSRYAAALGGRGLAVQHHHAHVASVLAERDAWTVPVLGFGFDGAGLGEDGAVWGGEVLHGALSTGFARVGHLKYAPLPGGDAAAHNPMQAAVGFVSALGEEAVMRLIEPPFSFEEVRVHTAWQLVRRGLNTPQTSSIGRLFDVVSALTGFRRSLSFEGQAAIRLEALALERSSQRPYPFPFDGRTWDYGPLLEALMGDVVTGVPSAVVARRFHEALAEGVVAAACALQGHHPYEAVVVSGGVFQNRLLLELVAARLRASGFTLWHNERVPAGDGGISLGQAALAAGRGGAACA
jgi:hydrogenase maturation protein HypF